MHRDCYAEQQTEVHRLTLALRNAYYEHNEHSCEGYSKPYGGLITESIGAWPEYILKGTFCKRSFAGLCSPCFYSRLPLSGQDRDEYLAMIRQQCSFVIDNFKELVIDKQVGETIVDIRRHQGVPCSLVLTPTGSFFDDFEFPIDIRIQMLEGLVHQSNRFDVDIVLYIESHCDDFLHRDFEDAQAIHEIELLKSLNAKIIFGFESADEYVRNTLYNKKLSIEDFEKAIQLAGSVGLSLGAFVFAGLFSMNDKNTIADVHKTVDYLISRSVMPVLMFENVQEYTLTDLLFKAGEINLLEPYTVLEIVSELAKALKDSQMEERWLIADPVGGPPKPEHNIFACAVHTCKECSQAIYDLLVELRTTRALGVFLEKSITIKRCSCYSSYVEHLSRQDGSTDDLVQNTQAVINRTKCLISNYIESHSALEGENHESP